MIDEKYIKLINQEIDGINSPRESKRLNKHLDQNPEARKLHKELSALSSLLSKIPIVEPPEHLEKNILKSVPFNTTTKRAKKQSIIQSFIEFLFGKKIDFAYAFSLWIIAGVVLLSIVYSVFFKHTSVNITDLYGTMIINQPVGNFHVSERLLINENNVQGDVQLSYSSDALLVEVKLNSQSEIDIGLEFAQNELVFQGFRKYNAVDNDLLVNNSSVRFSHKGENNYLIVLGRTTANLSPIHMKIFSSETLIFSNDLDI
ncbi:MAG: hypothetical protein QME52_10115 [Bacteroidota bacterium]|nr:hypothetical protein [Bacteroidota bacterium]